MSWLGLDIGGANLKVADGEGFALAREFPLWQRPAELSEAIGDLLADAPAAKNLAITMTGELADCFATKADGVREILAALQRAAAGRNVVVYLCDGRLVGPRVAQQQPWLTAASNWHVLASYVCRFCSTETGLLLDIGSTTTDIISIGLSGPRAVGRTDPERLVAGELVYTGVERSPLCAVTSHLPWRGEQCPVAQEVFATTLDAYLLLNQLPEDACNTHTADRRPRTRTNAHARLARAICADTTVFSLDDARLAAETVRDAQLKQLTGAAEKVLQRLDNRAAVIVLSGHGEFLARQMLVPLSLAGRVVSLTEQLGSEISRCACAHALAVLARERGAA